MGRPPVVRVTPDVCAWCQQPATHEALYPGSGDIPARVYGACSKCAAWLTAQLVKTGGRYPVRVEPARSRREVWTVEEMRRSSDAAAKGRRLRG